MLERSHEFTKERKKKAKTKVMKAGQEKRFWVIDADPDGLKAALKTMKDSRNHKNQL